MKQYTVCLSVVYVFHVRAVCSAAVWLCVVCVGSVGVRGVRRVGVRRRVQWSADERR